MALPPLSKKSYLSSGFLKNYHRSLHCGWLCCSVTYGPVNTHYYVLFTSAGEYAAEKVAI